jgi:molybdopterin converting factor subunit 1
LRVKVLYFAAVRDLAGTDEETLDLPDEVRTIDAFCTHLQRERSALDGRLGHVRFARNEEFARGTDPIAEGDVIALIPPVAGGA